MKWKVSRHRGGPEDKRVGSEVAGLQQPSRGPSCIPPGSPPLCHPADEGLLASIGWLSSSSPLEGCLYVCRVEMYSHEVIIATNDVSPNAQIISKGM